MWEEFRGCEANVNTGALDPVKDVSVRGVTEKKQPGWGGGCFMTGFCDCGGRGERKDTWMIPRIQTPWLMCRFLFCVSCVSNFITIIS